jgi:hypothetical protein
LKFTHETKPQSGQPEVGEKLSPMLWKQLRNSLKFHNHFFFDDEVQAVTAIEQHSFIGDRQRSLALKREVVECQLSA